MVLGTISKAQQWDESVGCRWSFGVEEAKAMTGTELEIIPPERSEIAGSDAERQPSLQTTARTGAAGGLAQVARRRL